MLSVVNAPVLAELAPIGVPSIAPPFTSIEENEDEPVDATLPVTFPVRSPVTLPVTAPVTLPVTLPVTAPVTFPVTFPVRLAVTAVANKLTKTCVTVAPEPEPLNLITASLPLVSSKSFDALYVPWNNMTDLFDDRLFLTNTIFSALFGVNWTYAVPPRSPPS